MKPSSQFFAVPVFASRTLTPLLMRLGFVMTLFLGLPFAQSMSGPDSLVAKRDSLERAIRQRSLTPEDKQNLSQCARTQRAFLTERRQGNPEVAKADSALRDLKLKRVSPNDPAALNWMERKYSLEKGFDEAWLATTEGRRCAEADSLRRKRLDAVVAADKQYRHLLDRLKRQGML